MEENKRKRKTVLFPMSLNLGRTLYITLNCCFETTWFFYCTNSILLWVNLTLPTRDPCILIFLFHLRINLDGWMNLDHCCFIFIPNWDTTMDCKALVYNDLSAEDTEWTNLIVARGVRIPTAFDEIFFRSVTFRDIEKKMK